MHDNYASLLYHRIDCDSLHYTYRDSFYCTRKYDAKHRFLEASRAHTHTRDVTRDATRTRFSEIQSTATSRARCSTNRRRAANYDRTG